MFSLSRRHSTVALLVACAIATLPSVALANHSWGGYHWARTSNPFTLKLGDNVSSTWDSILVTTSSDWSKSTVLDTTIVPGQAKGRCRPTSGRVEVCNAAYGNNNWLGLAQIWITDGTHITQGAVKLNDTYFNTPTYNTTAWRNLVSCQEVGHTLGLDHQDTNFDNPNLGTCMDYTSNPGTNQHPNQHDYDELVLIYGGHLDSSTTVGQSVSGPGNGQGNGHGDEHAAPPAMNQIDFDSPGQWGQLLRNSRHNSLYELDFGGGNKIFTFVIWANEDDE